MQYCTLGSPTTWVPNFKAHVRAAPGLDLRPSCPVSIHPGRKWVGSALPPVNHSRLVDLDTMARAQLATLSNLERLFTTCVDSSAPASPLKLDAVKGSIASCSTP